WRGAVAATAHSRFWHKADINWSPLLRCEISRWLMTASGQGECSGPNGASKMLRHRPGCAYVRCHSTQILADKILDRANRIFGATGALLAFRGFPFCHTLGLF